MCFKYTAHPMAFMECRMCRRPMKSAGNTPGTHNKESVYGIMLL
jgi:hypothetical protein